MKLKIKRLDESLPLPQYATSGAVAFDLYSRVDMEILPHEIALIPTNLIIKVPARHMLVVVSRSSMPIKKGILIPHGIGIIDQDYFGPGDEIKFQVLNFKDKPVKVKKGERLGQAVLVKIAKVEFEEIKEIKNQSRGGFGSTG